MSLFELRKKSSKEVDGKFTPSELKSMAISGEISPEDEIREAEKGKWHKAKSVNGLKFDQPDNKEDNFSGAFLTSSESKENAVNLFSKVGLKVGQIAQTEQVKFSSVKPLFKEIFASHDAIELEAYFAVGLPSTTPTIEEMETELKPWVFIRCMLFFALSFLLLWIGWAKYHNINLIPGIILVGSFAFPFSFIIFFFECNLPRNISLYTVVKYFVWGGILGILFSLFLFDNDLGTTSIFGASVAGIIEEPAKLAAVLLLARSRDFNWSLNGICLGAAVGAGFAAFESAGYALNILLISGNMDTMLDNIYLRGLLSPFAHVIWTAIAAGAFWRVKKSGGFEFNMLLKEKFLRPMIFVMALHFLWNSPIPSMLPFFLGYILLGIIGWILVLGLVFGGIKEIQQAKGQASIDSSRN